MNVNLNKYENMVITDHNIKVPLNYDRPEDRKINIFIRKVSRQESLQNSLPYLIFFQGGPGYESPRPISDSGWIKRATEDYNVLLIDQRGTGLSSPICSDSIKNMEDNYLAEYLSFFRADNIIRDAEYIRENIFNVHKWSILGQSFGGF